VLVRYLEERRASLDHSSFTSLAGILVGSFWADIEQRHPGIDTLRLPEDIAETWKQRARTVTDKDGHIRPRKDYPQIFMLVRAFYPDLQEWAPEDACWAEWSVPDPIRKCDTAGYLKARMKNSAAMHQRVRERLPHLPVLVDAVDRHKTDRAAFRAAAEATAIGHTFEHGGRTYRRTVPKKYTTTEYRDNAPPLHVTDLGSSEIMDLDRSEHEAFWAWAVIEVLRHTGVRIESCWRSRTSDWSPANCPTPARS
jgi:hypothetical protein